MSVSGTIRPAYRPYRAYDDPGLPDGIWWARAALQGDATGGSQILSVEFKPATSGSEAVNRLFSLEQYMIHIQGTAQVIQMEFGNWDAIGFLPLTGQLVGGDVNVTIPTGAVDSGGSAGSIFGRDVASGGRWFLGAPLKSVGSTDILFQMTNVDGDQLHVFLEGYWWETGAINAPGGPRRPVDALIGG